MVRIPSEIEKSISIDEDSEFETSQQDGYFSDHWPSTKNQLECDVARLKAQNTDRLQRRWDEIIAKYSNIDDDKESDEIDLNTGKITIDNGHLRSFADDGVANGSRVVSSVWAMDDNFEKETRRHKHAEKVKRRLRYEEKQRLKATAMFYKPHMKVVDSGSDVLEDNLSLLSPSPTKKHKSSSTSVSPSKPGLKMEDTQILGYGHRLATPQSSPLKGKVPSLAFSPSESSLESPSRPGSQQRVLLSPVRQKLDLKNVPHLGICPDSDGEDYTSEDDNLIDNSESDGLSHDLKSNTMASHQRDDVLEKEENIHEDDNNTEYEDSFSVLEICDAAPYAYFTCAFYGCPYTSQSKASYRAHLLSSHSPELRQIGYPVDTEKRYNLPLPGDTIPKLNVHFPLKIHRPPVRPHICGSETKYGRCQKMFIDESLFLKHKEQCPRRCSAKRQVLPCPVLGCDFMTDTSYGDFYRHIRSHETECMPKEESKHNPQHGSTDVAEYFSDSVSSISFSETEKENHHEDVLPDKWTTQVNQNSGHTKTESARKKDNVPKRHPSKYRPIESTTDMVPKLNILESGVNFNLDLETKARDSGYSSIEELFQDESS
ncbi:hypothetical protein JCM33374_g6003 [Metschnikowia sp. JCM 33374]|nr:hypothetical protein JCM33374_g6003 [Metschnikowia sp. JCM 33374]